jgi:hypothetical protein
MNFSKAKTPKKLIFYAEIFQFLNARKLKFFKMASIIKMADNLVFHRKPSKFEHFSVLFLGLSLFAEEIFLKRFFVQIKRWRLTSKMASKI